MFCVSVLLSLVCWKKNVVKKRNYDFGCPESILCEAFIPRFYDEDVDDDVKAKINSFFLSRY